MELKDLTEQDRDDLFNLDRTIAEWVLPKLIKFREVTPSYPGSCESLEEWRGILDKMISSFRIVVDSVALGSAEEDKEFDEGMRLFAEYFRALWL